LKFFFFISIALIFYVYLGYPLMAFLLSLFKKNRVGKAPGEPAVSIVIAAFNEEDCIAATLENKLALDYPKDRLEIIVVSDGSTDETENIVASYAGRNVRLLRQGPRAGKTSALNLAIPQAKGELIVFSDANSIYAPDALRLLAANFSDPAVGYVTGKMVYTNPDGSLTGDGCSAYMQYENLLREIETRLGSIVGVDGGIDAMRRGLYQAMKADQLPDFVQPLTVVEQGYRVVYEPLAQLREPTLDNDSDEYRMRVRVSLRALWAMWDMRSLLFGSRGWEYAWQLWSHKVLRYLCFIFLGLALVSNLMLLGGGGWYQFFLALQLVCYAGALLVPSLETSGMRTFGLKFCHYFLLLNLASAHAFFKFVCGQKMVLWTPRKG